MIDSDKQKVLEKIFSSLYSNSAIVSGPYGERMLTYADYIASGQPLKFIENYIEKNAFPFYANTHTEASFTGFQSSYLREEARNIIKQCVNATEEDVVIFCGTGSTAAIDKVHRLLNMRAEKGEKIIVFHGPFEHHSNVLPWREGNYKTIPIAITSDGLLDLEDLQNKLKENQGKGLLIGSFSAASNVTGIIAPIEEVTSILHEHGALSFWDYAAAAPYMKIDMNPEMGQSKDIAFISTHKFVGGPGTPGILIAKRALFTNEIPVVPSGGTVHFVTRNKQRYYEDIETREEGGTPGIIEAIRAGLCFKLKNEVGEELIHKKESEAVKYAKHELSKNSNILILGNTECERLAFFAFHIKSNGRLLHHNFIVTLLNDLFGIQARGGCSCAGPYGHELLGMSNEQSDEFLTELEQGNEGLKPGWARLNLNYFIPQYEIEFILNAVKWIADKGFLLLKEYHFDDKTALWHHKEHEKSPKHRLANFSVLSESAEDASPILVRETEQKKYLALADKIAAEAEEKWDSVPCQTYHYNQIDSPLRWFTLAQDVSLKGKEHLSV